MRIFTLSIKFVSPHQKLYKFAVYIHFAHIILLLRWTEKSGKYCMMDDRAPVELLGMKVIDELIKDEVAYYKEIYNEKGIKGLIDKLN